MVIPTLGTPKYDDLGTLQTADILQMAQGMRELINNGHPIDLPIGIPLQDLARLTLTMQAYIELIKRVSTASADDIEKLAADATAILNVPPPPVIKSRVLNPR